MDCNRLPAYRKRQPLAKPVTSNQLKPILPQPAKDKIKMRSLEEHNGRMDMPGIKTGLLCPRSSSALSMLVQVPSSLYRGQF